MITRREILATINATTRETGYERVLAGDLLEAIQTDNIAALKEALKSLSDVAMSPWAFALAVHDTCGTMIKRHTVGAKAAWSRVPGWAARHEGEALATLALMCYLVHESGQHPDAVDALPVAICWGS
jgi:hypothetical protein|nr:MAG TPA: hypothetical protein [Caudoviricetes sp.]